MSVYYLRLKDGSLAVGDLFDQHADFRLFFPRVIQLTLATVRGSLNIPLEIFVGVGVVFLTFLSYLRLARRNQDRKLGEEAVIRGGIALCLFSPVLFGVWLRADSMLTWPIPFLCLALALNLVTSGLSLGRKTFGCILLCFVAQNSILHGALVWPVVGVTLLGYWQLKEPEKKGLYLKALSLMFVAMVLSSVLYFKGFHFYSKPAELAPVLSYLYFLLTWAAPFPSAFAPAVGAAVLLVFFLVNCVVFGTKRLSNEEKIFCLPWTMLGTFCLLSGLVITIGRTAEGQKYALQTRYMPLSFSLILATWILFLRICRGRVLYWAASLGFVSVFLVAYPVGLSRMKKDFEEKARGLTALQFSDVFPANPDLKFVLRFDPAGFTDSLRLARRLRTLGVLRTNFISEEAVTRALDLSQIRSAPGASFSQSVLPDRLEFSVKEASSALVSRYVLAVAREGDGTAKTVGLWDRFPDQNSLWPTNLSQKRPGNELIQIPLTGARLGAEMEIRTMPSLTSPPVQIALVDLND